MKILSQLDILLVALIGNGGFWCMLVTGHS